MNYVYKVLEAQGQMNIPRDLESEVYQLMTQSLLIMFTGLMTAHAIIYLTHWFNRKFSRGYIKLYAATATLGCFALFVSSPLQNLHFAVLTFFYGLVAWGLIRKKEQ
ncbi:hypothetical protein M899_1101 [Bacteriovorax sp. BSW11_IV]|nr:hypothetical protein M899_1101 [Bacteriovorax sp. BSW11_IV]